MPPENMTDQDRQLWIEMLEEEIQRFEQRRRFFFGTYAAVVAAIAICLVWAVL
jgi:hypothetical protein